MSRPAPSFIIIGTMKSGTTTLFNWIRHATGFSLCERKEPRFFTDDRKYSKGVNWYRDLFPDEPTTGEASTSYTEPHLAEIAAQRIALLDPTPQLMVLLRHPLSRARGHYKHQVLAGRERRPFARAVASRNSPYIAGSLYSNILSPYLERGLTPLVVQSEDLFGPSEEAWNRVLRHLFLPPASRPETRFNVSDKKTPATPLLRSIRSSEVVLAATNKAAGYLPIAIKKALKPLLFRPSVEVQQLLVSAEEDFPPSVTAILLDSARQVATTTDISLRLWGIDA